MWKTSSRISQILQVVASTSILRSAYQRRTIFSCAAGGSRRSRGGSCSTYRWFLWCLSPSSTLLQPARWVQCLICQMAQKRSQVLPVFQLSTTRISFWVFWTKVTKSLNVNYYNNPSSNFWKIRHWWVSENVLLLLLLNFPVNRRRHIQQSPCHDPKGRASPLYFGSQVCTTVTWLAILHKNDFRRNSVAKIRLR